jgi:pyruvate, orthophosphate dikinase
MAKAPKFVYYFGPGKSEGNASMKNLLGGKGANLADMAFIGLPVPPGFTITTEVCVDFYKNKQKYPIGLKEQVQAQLAQVEKDMGKKFNDPKNPLLLSVRSGARVSMPGMMDTVLNLGLNDKTVEGLIAVSGDARFAYDSYRRFVQMYSDVVLGVHTDFFEAALHDAKHAAHVEEDTDLTADQLKTLVATYKGIVLKALGKPFPEDAQQQLWGAIGAVFQSWMSERAIVYRRLTKVPEEWGTAVSVQSMVFGNAGSDCATGVAFTRNPSTGERKYYGEYLINAQGEDVVAGIRTPQPVTKIAKKSKDEVALEEVMPKAYKQLAKTFEILEKHYRDMQDIEFTIEHNRLFMLQTRNGKRTGAAAVRIAVEMVKEKLISKDEAILRVDANSLNQLLHPSFNPKAAKTVVATGLPASPGAASGQIVFTAKDSVRWGEDGKVTILVRQETSPEDIEGMVSAQGILTGRGGMTSHAAVVARGMGKTCVAGCSSLLIDAQEKIVKVRGHVLREGDWISINGSTGEVMLGKVETVAASLTGEFATFMKWADELKTLGVRANADVPKDAQVAVNFGAQGIGLCRTEHMFFEGDRITYFREMILAKDVNGRKAALAKLLPIQRADFEGLFLAMKGYPVTIRLLDPPLHEFLPHTESEQEEMARTMGVSKDEVREKVNALHEFNPMLGHRGCRLGITYPEIYDMQVQAIIEAAINLNKKGGKVIPEIMIPLVGAVKELTILKENAINVINDVLKAKGIKKLDYLIGTMIEIPRAALIANQLAVHADFFSFGTNDLTQMAFGYSRDDSGVFLPAYVEQKILADDPFQALDQEGVGQLVEYGVTRGRSTNPKLKVGICGEHGGEPSSVKFCHKMGLNYVSCSPFRVPIARLAAAQAAVQERLDNKSASTKSAKPANPAKVGKGAPKAKADKPTKAAKVAGKPVKILATIVAKLPAKDVKASKAVKSVKPAEKAKKSTGKKRELAFA